MDDDEYIQSQQNPIIFNLEEFLNPSNPTAPRVNTVNKWNRNPILAKIASQRINYKCELDCGYELFESGSTGMPFLEAHHLLPIANQSKYSKNLDCLANICILCPNCHRKIHYGKPVHKTALINQLYNLKITDLNTSGIVVSLADLLVLYKV